MNNFFFLLFKNKNIRGKFMFENVTEEEKIK